jgi:hypothetical protein
MYSLKSNVLMTILCASSLYTQASTISIDAASLSPQMPIK